MELTEGQRRIQTNFTANDAVSNIKQKFADLIDYLNEFKPKVDENGVCEPGYSEKARLIAISKTEIEQAAMWSVKAIIS